MSMVQYKRDVVDLMLATVKNMWLYIMDVIQLWCGFM